MSFVPFSMTINLIPLLSFFNGYLNDYLSYAYVPVLVLLPVAGWIGDSLLGRYRAITSNLPISSYKLGYYNIVCDATI